MDELTDFERLVQSINRFADIVRKYYLALIEMGFDEDQAMFLTSDFQRIILDNSKSKGLDL